MNLPYSPILSRPDPVQALVLFLLEQGGCDHCARAESELAKYLTTEAKKGNSHTPMVIRRDGARTDAIAGWRPKSTPAYALTLNGKLAAKHEGVLTETQLRKLISEALNG